VIDETLIRSIFRPRDRFSHKGTHGHALLMGGSYGSIGAITLSANACLRSGAGLVTTYIPTCGYTILQTAAPEAMVITGSEERFLTTLPPGLEKYNALGIGPGMGTQQATQEMVRDVLSQAKQPLIIDADGLNCLALQDGTLDMLPPGSVLTPHPKEFERLFGKTANEFERLELARRKSGDMNIVIVLKGHHTYIALPDGKGYFNNNGNAGMAKGGSGDVLTGIIAGLLAQNYNPGEAAILGVYIHGLAGDLAAKELSEEAMTAGDLIRFLPKAFLQLAQL
ncbi:MAG TPA: NAD(P)H-hydrate dehydratase, partial [Chitinophagaceae bacterium]|nr:NAD(P)H-hydrate dehydratase [Chitinophagaceae bacterium]